ncbi:MULTISPECIES: ureidoglycolate lyase [Halomonadaceae]|uniref:ureidoglycolate lyase n=1 Tax=Halomonadaceae TaxID=28256 RepID=UPI00159AC39F|nr:MULTISPECIES: ureidoglycolate lyase [unclassified Halomonas]QJQ95217.1 ureidoglycolate hydrolase [Halomonas sp. PA5]
MTAITAQPLTQESFAQFGEVLDLPRSPGRHFYSDTLGNLRESAKPSLSISLIEPSPKRPLRVEMLERHEFSSQSFVPIDVDSWIVIVAPHDASGAPDMDQLQVFMARGDQGVTYRPNIWHHGVTVLGASATFAVFMWLTGDGGDEEFVDVSPMTVNLP